MTKTVSTAAGGIGVAGFAKKAKGVTPPSKPGRRGVFLTDVIVELGFADQKKVDAVVQAARNSAKTVEDLLLDHGAVDEAQLSMAIAERYGLDHVDLETFEVDMEAAAKITRAMGHRHFAVPVAFARDGALIVAVADPFDSTTSSDIEEMTRTEVRLAIAAPRLIRRLLRRIPGDPATEAEASLEEEAPTEEERPAPPGAQAALEADSTLEPVESPGREPEGNGPAKRAPESNGDRSARERPEPVVERSVEEGSEPEPQPEKAEEPGVEEPDESRAGAAHSGEPATPARPDDDDAEPARRRAQRVEGELIVARRQIADLKEQVSQKGSNSPELARKHAELGRRAEELEQRAAALEKQKMELQQQKVALEAQTEELRAQSGRLEGQNTLLKAKLAELSRWAGEVVSVAEEATRVTTRLDGLRRAVEDTGD